ncbi:hypothetical protein FRC10_001385 [Ceratobasidium sp. 414]|nr:hypothetical protein FRC10_001385 [Ceratobasidium sp. 414]
MPLFGSSHRPPTFTVPSANAISGSSFDERIQMPHKIAYPKGWREGDTESWYKGQPTTKFTHLQYRKEREGPFYHEYIVAEFDNDTVCRFDRRGDVATRAGAFTFKGTVAEDTAHVIHKYETHYTTINNNSDMVLRIHFPYGQDLLTILGICYGVQKDDETRAYTLTRYNRYFLSWTIVTATIHGNGRTTIEGLNAESPSLRSRIKDDARTVFGLGRKNSPGPSSGLDTIPFVGAGHLTNTLREALFDTRSNIQQSLGQLIFQTTVETSMRRITDESAQKSAAKAARNHAG